jgi:hypothetical protein
MPASAVCMCNGKRRVCVCGRYAAVQGESSMAQEALDGCLAAITAILERGTATRCQSKHMALLLPKAISLRYHPQSHS